MGIGPGFSFSCAAGGYYPGPVGQEEGQIPGNFCRKNECLREGGSYFSTLGCVFADFSREKLENGFAVAWLKT